MPQPLTPQEESTIRAFIVKERRDRWLDLLRNPRRRRTITAELAHPNLAWFDSRFVQAIPPNQRNASGIGTLLRAKGAKNQCWAISEDGTLDGKELVLASALSSIVGSGMGTILCCVPGKLAFVESEDGRFILEKP